MLVALAAVAITAHLPTGHRVDSRITESGVAYLENEIPTLLPDSFSLPTQVWNGPTCFGNQVVLTQTDTDIDVVVDDLRITPDGGELNVALDFHGAVTGHVEVDNPLCAIAGYLSCDDSLYLSGASAIARARVTVSASGVPSVEIIDFQLIGDPEDIAVTVSNCPQDGFVNTVLDWAKTILGDWALEQFTDWAETEGTAYVTEKIEDILVGFGHYEGAIFDGNMEVDIEGQLGGVTLSGGTIDVYADADVLLGDAAQCIAAQDPGEPDASSARYDFGSATSPHVMAAVPISMVDDLLYTVWRDGRFCIDTPEDLESWSIDFDPTILNDLANLPEDTDIRVMFHANKPPRVNGAGDAMADYYADVDDFDCTIVAKPEGGEELRLDLDVDAEVGYVLEYDFIRNELRSRISSARVDRLAIEDHFGLEEIGLNYSAVRALIESLVLPKALVTVTEHPIGLSLFEGLGNRYYMIPRALYADKEQDHLVAGAEIFKVPEFDTGTPNTLIADAPSGVVGLREAVITVTGTDNILPPELLQYEFNINGEWQEKTHIPQVQVGVAGETADYTVKARAIDLHDNTDQSPVEVTITVDGSQPTLEVDKPEDKVIDRPTHVLTWTMGDDYTAHSDLVPRIEIQHLVDGQLIPISDEELPSGSTAVEITVTRNVKHSVVVEVSDEAGNKRGQTIYFNGGENGAEPESGMGDMSGGCSAAGGGPGASWLWLLALVAIAGRVRSCRRRGW